MTGIESLIHDIAWHPGLKFALYSLGASLVLVSGDEHKLRRAAGLLFATLAHWCH
jgi:hypothetical protein